MTINKLEYINNVFRIKNINMRIHILKEGMYHYKKVVGHKKSAHLHFRRRKTWQAVNWYLQEWRHKSDRTSWPSQCRSLEPSDWQQVFQHRQTGVKECSVACWARRASLLRSDSLSADASPHSVAKTDRSGSLLIRSMLFMQIQMLST